MLTRWHRDLIENHYLAVYVNAWESDFSDDPLVAFIAALEKQINPLLGNSAKKSFAKALKTAKQLIKPALPLLLAIAAKKLTGYSLGELDPAIKGQSPTTSESNGNDVLKESISTLISKSAEEALREHQSREKTIADFRNYLGAFVDKIEALQAKRLPFTIFVDELDRCRPTYAIQLLEQIKHVFGVRGVYFVIATDSRQLAHSIKAVYGSEFAAERYLRRFFDQEYSLPEPDSRSFAKFLFQRYSMEGEQRFFTPLDTDLYDGADTRIEIFALLSDFFRLSLRDQEQACLVLDAIRHTSKSEEALHLFYVLFLIMLKQRHVHIFDDFVFYGLAFSSIEKNLQRSCDRTGPIKTRELQERVSAIPKSIDLYRFIQDYCNIAQYSSKAIADSFNNKNSKYEAHARVIEQIFKAKSINPNKVLAHYVDLVNHAGQFLHAR